MPRGSPQLFPYLLLLLCLSQLVGCAEVPRPADLVFRGGAVYTLNPELPWADAVAVVDGRIAYVGDDAGLSPWIGESTEVIELGDGMLMPGFVDSHLHPMSAGTTYLRCPLNDLAWPDEVLTRLSQCAARLGEGDWLRATGLADSVLAGHGPGITELDRVSGGHPAVISNKFSRHVLANSLALEIAGIDANTPDPPGGAIARDPETAEPSGVLRGSAVSFVWGLASDYPQDALREGLRLASQMANQFGITSASDAAVSAAHWRAYRAAEDAGEMTLRVNAAMRWNPSAGDEQLPALNEMRSLAAGPLFSAKAVKLFLDGDFIGRTAALLDPYDDTTASGTSYYGDRLPQLVSMLDAAGFDLHMHAYGDRAVRNGLDAITKAKANDPARDRRHQLAHIVLIDPADVPRFAALGVTADIQPLWAWMDEERKVECEVLGPQLCSRLLPFRDLFDSGARVVAGSDWISDSMNPLYNIQVALTRQPPDGSGEAWNPGQRATLEQMLNAYTLNGAWQMRQEALTGSIEVGKAADLIVLERNLFEVDPRRLEDVKVLLTLLEGAAVYTR